MDVKYLIFIGLAMLTPAIENIGLGLQKLAIDKIPAANGRLKKSGWTFVWILGFALTIVVALLIFKTMSLGNASTVGAFSGFGLIVLALFSRFVLKEKILPRELIGILIIMSGTSLIGYFSHGHQNTSVDYDSEKLLIFILCQACLIGAGFAVTVKAPRLAGVILGIIAGSIAGLSVTTQKILSHTFLGLFRDPLHADYAAIALTPVTWIMVLYGIGGVVLLQFAYKKGKAVQVVPSRATGAILTPLIAGVALLNESVPPLSLLGTLVIIAGIIVTTTANPAKAEHHGVSMK